MLSRSFLSMYISSSWCKNQTNGQTMKNSLRVFFPHLSAGVCLPVCCSLSAFPGSGGEQELDLQWGSSRGFAGQQHSLRKHVCINNQKKKSQRFWCKFILLCSDGYQPRHPLELRRLPWGALLVGRQHRCMLGRQLEAAVACGEWVCVLLCFLHLAKKKTKRTCKEQVLYKKFKFICFWHFSTFSTGQRADRPYRAPAERVVPVGVAGGAGWADRQTSWCQVHHFFCWRDQCQT